MLIVSPPSPPHPRTWPKVEKQEDADFSTVTEGDSQMDTSQVINENVDTNLVDRPGRKKKPVLHVEARVKQNAPIRHDTLANIIETFISQSYECLYCPSEIREWDTIPSLDAHIEQVKITDCDAIKSSSTSLIRLKKVQIRVHTYQAVDTPDEEFTAEEDNDDYLNTLTGNNNDTVMAASVTELPSVRYEGLWDTLIYENGIKESLLHYIHSTFSLSGAEVDFNIISWNRLLLLHGPPGTGKTSLCRALAQKMSIRLSNKYRYGKLIEINSHSLFSKWFSESGKLIQRLFSRVHELVKDEDCFVVVLIDEVESLTAARMGAMSGKEPSDALRAVNALLTQLDKLKTYQNTLVVTTSNLSESIDPAFVDRADLKQFIDLPPAQAVYWILQTCLEELDKKGVIASPYPPSMLHSWDEVQRLYFRKDRKTATEAASLCLAEVALLCEGLSGRRLRRLPVLAYARLNQQNYFDESDDENDNQDDNEMLLFIEALKEVVQEEVKQHNIVKKGGSLTNGIEQDE